MQGEALALSHTEDGSRASLVRLAVFPWMRVKKFDAGCCALADRHYSRRRIGSNQFMPPGQTVVLTNEERSAVFGWWRPDPSSSLKAMNGLDGWTCTIFRNEGNWLSSGLVLAAERALMATGLSIGPDGLLTYVWDKRIRSSNPGYCFKMAGWKAVGRSADGRKTLLQKLQDFGFSPGRAGQGQGQGGD